jgi:hypothetical protein
MSYPAKPFNEPPPLNNPPLTNPPYAQPAVAMANLGANYQSQSQHGFPAIMTLVTDRDTQCTRSVPWAIIKSLQSMEYAAS